MATKFYIKDLNNVTRYPVTNVDNVEGLSTELEKKVNKVDGKGLSTEDFTSTLKTKLEGLSNYNDTELTTKVNNLKNQLDTLVGSADATAVIDTFNEIEAFLNGVTNTQTLTGMLQEQKTTIENGVANTYVKKADYTANDVLAKIKSVDGTGSGLDADLLDGLQPSELNVGSADKLTTKQLTNEDLNEIKDGNFNSYYALNSNTCANKPTNSNNVGFSLQVYGANESSLVQIFTRLDTGVSYKRNFNNTWSSWKKMLTEDDIASLLDRVTELESKVNAITWVGTQAAYDALPTKNDSTLYCIIEE